MKNVLLPSVCRGCDGRASSGPSPFALDPDKGARQPKITQQQSRISKKKKRGEKNVFYPVSRPNLFSRLVAGNKKVI